MNINYPEEQMSIYDRILCMLDQMAKWLLDKARFMVIQVSPKYLPPRRIPAGFGMVICVISMFSAYLLLVITRILLDLIFQRLGLVKKNH